MGRTGTTAAMYIRVIPLWTAFALMQAFAGGPDTWIPARWPGGPLELQRRAMDKTLPSEPATRDAILQWYDPVSLDLLQGTPINCLLLTWSGGGETEAEKLQQRLVKTYARAAHSRGISVLAIVRTERSLSSIGESALNAGLDGLVMEGVSSAGESVVSGLRLAMKRGNSSAVAFPISPWEGLTRAFDILAPAEAAVPGIRDLSEMISATPSSEPWIDFNVWLVRSLRSWGGSRPVWLGEQLAEDAAPADYLRAIADAAAGGGLWAVALSNQLRLGLSRKQPEAMTTWRRMTSYLKFQQDHAEWFSSEPFAVCGFIQDSARKSREMSGENLKLACRRRIPLRIIERAQFDYAALEGLRAVQAIDVVQPTRQERKLLSAFAENGGMVVVGPGWKQLEIPKDQDFAVVRTGKGRVVVYRETWPEPSGLAKDMVDLLGRDNLGIRLFRASSVLSHASRDRTGGRVFVQLINYSSYPAESVLVRVAGEFRSARLHTPERTAEELTLEKVAGGIEVNIPLLPIYAGLVLEK